MIDTLIYVMVVMIDTTVVNNRFDKVFDEANRKFNIEMLKQASHEAAINAGKKNKTYQIKILDLYRKEKGNERNKIFYWRAF